MDINTLHGIMTALALFAFISVCIWAWSSKRKNAFDEAANLPFADEDIDQNSQDSQHDSQ